jgi:hypothetical protein
MTDLIRPFYVGKLKAAEQRLAHVQQLDPVEQRQFLRDAEAEVERARQKLTDYDRGVSQSRKA